uniref:Uncharacterized protein n=1 Tax=Magallana gigas TaxID=29159 RepID=A0A8W8KB33_MAGGI
MHMVTLKTLFSDLLFLHPTCVRYQVKPPVSDAFRKQPSRPSTQAGRAGNGVKPCAGAEGQKKTDATLRFTKSAEGKREPLTQVNTKQENMNTF